MFLSLKKRCCYEVEDGSDFTTIIYSTAVLYYQWKITAGKKLVSLLHFSIFLSLVAAMSVQFVSSVLRNTQKVGIKLQL